MPIYLLLQWKALTRTVPAFADVCSPLAQLWLCLEPLFPVANAELHPAVAALLPWRGLLPLCVASPRPLLLFFPLLVTCES